MVRFRVLSKLEARDKTFPLDCHRFHWPNYVLPVLDVGWRSAARFVPGTRIGGS